MEVLLRDLQAEMREIDSPISDTIHSVLNKGWFILGDRVKDFEKEWSDYISVKEAVGCASGTEAIALSLMALGISSRDEVIVQANTCVPTIAGIRMTGATPILVDVKPDTLQVNPDEIEKVITSKTKAIMPVHLYGTMADMEKLTELSKQNKIALIEDCAQAHGSTFNERKAGTFGNIGCYSFYPSKNLGACGDAGAVVTNDDALAASVRSLRNYGESEVRFEHNVEGLNSRLDEMQAAILSVKLSQLDKWNQRRITLANVYLENLRNIPQITLPITENGANHIYHLFVIRVKNRDGLKVYLENVGIQTAVHYPIPVHMQKAYLSFGYKHGDFPITEMLSEEILTLPLSPQVTEEQIEFVVANIEKFYKNE